MKKRILSNSKYLLIILIGFTISCNQQFANTTSKSKNDLLKEQTSKINRLLEAKEKIIGNYINNEGGVIQKLKSYDIQNLSVNTKEDDFSPSIINVDKEEYSSKGIVFASGSGNNPNSLKYQKKNNNRPFMDMFYSYKNEDRSFSKPTLLENSFLWQFEDPRLNTDFHDGVVTFTNNGKKMYLTQNNDSLSSKDTLNLVIISYSESDGKWKKDDEHEFEYNNPEYNCAHPTISNDGNRLFFSSNMPNGLGGMDIYVRNKLYDGSWGVAKNLGPGINTKGNEIFPFINVDNALYFASDGHKGLGGLDIYKTFYDENGKWIFPVNIGDPLNSSLDDFGITFFSEGDSGYFCSNRPGGKGNDDIYFFKGTRNPIQLDILIIDSISNIPIDSAVVKITRCNNDIEKDITNVKGKVTRLITTNLVCEITAIKNKYVPKTIKLVEEDFTEGSPVEKIIRLQETYYPGKIIDLPLIFYDLDKSFIRPDAAVELDKLVLVMIDNPGLKIELRSHTDCRNTDRYNMRLSDDRAKAAVKYLVSKDIPASRMVARGYGEKELINGCVDGVECSEEEHQANRRTEFKVLSTTYVAKN